MKTVTKCAAQGDCIIRRVGSIPAGYEKQKRDGHLIVSHSETGHHHIIATDNVDMFVNPKESLVCYLQMGVDVCDFTLEHLRSYDTHEALKFKGEPGSVWEVRRQREHTPEGWRRVQD